MKNATITGCTVLVLTLILAREPLRRVGCRVLAVTDNQVALACANGHGIKVDDQLELVPLLPQPAGD